jgi:hypothetical protein
MGVYAELLSDEEIARLVEGAGTKVLLVTCPGCACESISYAKGVPNRSLAGGKDFEHSALAVHAERDRLERLLRAAGKVVENVTIGFPCEMYDPERELARERAEGKDFVAVLACGGGLLGMRDALEGLATPLIPLMRSVGTFMFRIIKDPCGESTIVDAARSRIIRSGAE